MIGFKQYLGLDSAHLESFERHDGGAPLLIERTAKQAFQALQEDAKQHGFILEACSAHRSFMRQAQLFGAKFLGQRPILDRDEQVISEPIVDPVKRMQAILVFSAMPGFSRHHFGSDLDIYAPNLLPEGQNLQLTYHEYLPGAYFYELGQYLNEYLSKFDFANPYAAEPVKEQAKRAKEQSPQPMVDLSQSEQSHQSSSECHNDAKNSPQVGFEPWHISHLPSARPYLEAYDIETALDYVTKQDLPYAKWVKEVMSLEQIEAMLRFDIC